MPAIAWASGPGSPAWSARRAARRVSSAKASAGPAPAAPDHERREKARHQARAVLGAAAREVAPDLAMAGRAVGGAGAHDHRRAVGHRAEGGAHRPRDRRAVDRDGELGELEGRGLGQAHDRASGCCCVDCGGYPRPGPGLDGRRPRGAGGGPMTAVPSIDDLLAGRWRRPDGSAGAALPIRAGGDRALARWPRGGADRGAGPRPPPRPGRRPEHLGGARAPGGAGARGDRHGRRGGAGGARRRRGHGEGPRRVAPAMPMR